MKTLRKGQYVYTMRGISPVDFGGRIGKIIKVTTGHKPFKYREVKVQLLDGDKSIKTYEDDTLDIISKNKAMMILKNKYL